MPLPLIIKAAAIGGAAYAASRWLSGQRRQRLHSTSPYPSASSMQRDGDDTSVPREIYPGDAPPSLGISSGPSS